MARTAVEAAKALDAYRAIEDLRKVKLSLSGAQPRGTRVIVRISDKLGNECGILDTSERGAFIGLADAKALFVPALERAVTLALQEQGRRLEQLGCEVPEDCKPPRGEWMGTGTGR